MAKQNENSTPLSGFFIYRNKYNQNVYYDIFTKNAYIISKDDEKQYNLYSSRLPMSIVLSVFLILVFNISPYIGIAAGAVAYVFFTNMFHKNFLGKLPIDSKFVRYKRENPFVTIAKETSLGKMIILIIVPVIIIVLTIINIKTAEMGSQQLLGQFILILLALGFGGFYGIATFIKLTRKY